MNQKYSVGYKTVSKQAHYLEFPRNTDDLIENHIVVDQMGGGKTNLLMSITYGLFKTYQDTNGKYGSLPIVFVPKFEWYKLGLESVNENISPDLSPSSLDCNQITFPSCNRPDHIKIPMYSINFKELTVEDIGTFANMRSIKDLGRIKAYMRSLPSHYTIKEFLEGLFKEKKDGSLVLDDSMAGIYYVFSELLECGLFDTNKYPLFDWETEVRKLKPVVFSFGNITNEMFQAFGGFLLRKLYALGDHIYNNIILKKNMIEEAKQSGKKIDVSLSDADKFLLKWFNVALLIDECPRLFVATTSSSLAGFPATKYFQIISSNDGRKMGFRYTYLVTQYYKDVYFKFRKRCRFTWFGSRVSKEDRDFIEEHKILVKSDIPVVLKNKKFYFSVIDMRKYLNNFDSDYRAVAITKFMTYRSPCGVF